MININEETEANTFKGYIDYVEAGFIVGWAAEGMNQEPLEIDVYANGNLIGAGKTGLLRPDVRELEIGFGNNGFNIATDLKNALFDEETILELREHTTGQIIDGSRHILEKPDQFFWLDFDGFSNGQLVGVISSNKPIGKRKLMLFDQDILLTTIEIENEANAVKFSTPCPLSLLDGRTHILSFGLKKYSRLIGSGIFKQHPIQTPWQYLKEGFKEPGFLNLPKQADHRYESLELQTTKISNDIGKISLSDLTTVHQAVVESHIGRKVYPKFSLPKAEKPRVSVIVSTYNNFSLSYNCIASLALAYNDVDYEVILADDCSTDETAKAENYITNLVISRNKETIKFLDNCNQAVEKAKGEYIVFLSDHTEVTSHWLDELVNTHEQNSEVGLTGSMLLNTDGTLHEAGGIVWRDGEPWSAGRDANQLLPEFNYSRQVDYVSSTAMCIPLRIWKEIGGFSQEFAPCYLEDVDLAFKIREAGYKTLYVPTSRVIHYKGHTNGTSIEERLENYQVANQSAFRDKWLDRFRNNGKPSKENVWLEKDRNIDFRILMIDYATPMSNNDAGSYAAIQEIKLIQSLGFKVTFVPTNLVHFGKHTTELQKMGVEVLYHPFYQSLEEVIHRRSAEMDAIYITRYEVAEKYIDLIKRLVSTPVLFNNADLHFLRELRSALQNGRDEKAVQASIETRKKELLVCEKADAVLCYNQTEHAVITSHIYRKDHLHVTPWVIEEKAAGPSFEEREGIAFLGYYGHMPNIETVKFLVKEIMPVLANARPDIHLYIYGSNMPDDFKQHEGDNIKIKGYADNLDDVYRNHRVFVAPLLSGAGIKGKVLEAMAYGMPTVLSEVAAEGTGLTNGVSTLTAGRPDEWASSIIKLYDDKVLWNRIAENENHIVHEQFSFKHGQAAFRKIFESIGIYTNK